MATIKLKNGSGAPLASDLVQGEPALDLTNKRLYTEDTLGAVIEVGVNPTELNVTGNITVGGTVDGRDIATDGTKLDGIEAGATADQTAAEIRTLVDSATDSNVFTDADHTKLDGIEAGADVTDTTNVTAAGAVMDSELTNETAVKALNQGVASSDSPTFAGLTTTADVSFGDNDKAIFGASSDLQIYHTGSPSSNSVIEDAGAGNLLLKSNGNGIQFRDGSDSLVFSVDLDSATTLYHNTSAKLATTSTGIDVSGTIVSYGVKSIDNLELSADYNSSSSATYSNILFKTDGSERMRIDSNGNVGIGTSSPNNLIHVEASDNGDGITIQRSSLTSGDYGQLSFNQSTNDAGTPNVWIRGHRGSSFDTSYMTLGTGGATGTERMRIDSSGNVGIGTTSPQEELHIEANYPQLRIASDLNVLSSNNLTCTIDGYATDGRAWRIGRSFGNSDMQITNDRSSSMTFATNNTERMRIDSAGRVGIGTSSPSRKFTVQGASGDTLPARIVGGSGTTTSGLEFQDPSTTGDYKVQIGSVGDNLYLRSGGAEAIRIDASGNVGIGTSSPSAKLQVDDGAGSAFFVGFANSNYYRSGQHVFQSLNNTSEYMRIDSGGNLLVGKTSQNFSLEGCEILPNKVQVTRDGGASLALNRKTSDGAIQTFSKDGATVGSIGTSGGSLDVYSSTTDRVGLRLAQAVIPMFNGAASPNTVDLGTNTRQFKDLYLSGGVYLGGVAAANKLDDYEEGTWTPVASNSQGFTLGTPTGANGSYTKVGRTVNLKCGFTSLDSTEVIAVGDRFEVSGIPFNASGNYTAATASSGSCFIYNSFGGGVLATGTVTHSGSILIVFIDSVLGSPTFSNDFNLGLVYETTA
jgi:hypothetical protein